MFYADITDKHVEIGITDIIFGCFILLMGLFISCMIVILAVKKATSKKEKIGLITMAISLLMLCGISSYFIIDRSNIFNRNEYFKVSFHSVEYDIEEYKNINGEEKFKFKDKNYHVINDKITQQLPFDSKIETTNNLKKGDKVTLHIKGIEIKDPNWTPKQSYDIDEILQMPGNKIEMKIEKVR